MFFFLSLGSNIDAEQSSVKMLSSLCFHFGCIGAYPFKYTEPFGIRSETRFINALVILHADVSEKALKSTLINIEESMGRDRAHPMSSSRSRRADIDILGKSVLLTNKFFKNSSEPYVECCFNLEGKSPDLSKYGLTSYQRPASIHLDTLTGDIIVVEDELERFKNGLETTFNGQQ